jgi:hypothetical protein
LARYKTSQQRLTLMPYIYQSVSERCARPKRCRSSGPLRALMSRMRKSIPGGVFDRATASEQSGRSSAARQILAALSSRACSRTQLSTLTPRPSLGNVISLGRSYLDTRHPPAAALPQGTDSPRVQLQISQSGIARCLAQWRIDFQFEVQFGNGHGRCQCSQREKRALTRSPIEAG